MYQMPSLFESYKGASLFPSVEAAVSGLEQAKYGKEPFKVTDYCVKVFDMSKEDDRTEYCKLMERLMPLCQNAQCVVVKNELQVLNGSGWCRYVEWFEYKLNETSLTGKVEPEKLEEAGESEDSNDLDGSNDDHDGIW